MLELRKVNVSIQITLMTFYISWYFMIHSLSDHIDDILYQLVFYDPFTFTHIYINHVSYDYLNLVIFFLFEFFILYFHIHHLCSIIMLCLVVEPIVR